MSQENVALVRSAFAAAERGHPQGILDAEVEWDFSAYAVLICLLRERVRRTTVGSWRGTVEPGSTTTWSSRSWWTQALKWLSWSTRPPE